MGKESNATLSFKKLRTLLRIRAFVPNTSTLLTGLLDVLLILLTLFRHTINEFVIILIGLFTRKIILIRHFY